MKLILEFYDKDIRLIFDNKKREGNPKILISDISKAQSIGFQPQIHIEEGIKSYVDWFKKI